MTEDLVSPSNDGEAINIVPLSDSEDDKAVELTIEEKLEQEKKEAEKVQISKKTGKPKKVISQKQFDHLERVRHRAFEAMKERTKKVREYDQLKKEVEEYKKLLSVVSQAHSKQEEKEEPKEEPVQRPPSVKTQQTFRFGKPTHQATSSGFFKRKL